MERERKRKRHTEQFRDLQKLADYKRSTVLSKMQEQHVEQPFGDRVVVVFSDIDDTLRYIPSVQDIRSEHVDASSPAEVASVLEERKVFYQTTLDNLTTSLEEHHIPLIAVTGRAIEHVTSGQKGGEKYAQDHLPDFDVIVASMGTEVFIRQKDGTYLPDRQFAEKVQQTGFSREKIYPACEDVVARMRESSPNFQLRFQQRDAPQNVLAYRQDPHANENGLTDQDPPERYKISFTCDGDDVVARAVRHQLQEKLASMGLSSLRIVVSSDQQLPSGGQRYNIDIVPFTKKDTINYLIEQYGCWGIVGGDSGNDADAIMGAGQAGFVVGNRREELAKRVRTLQPNETLLREEPHFTIIQTDDGGRKNERFLYIDPRKERKGPESVSAALRAYVRLFSMSK